MNNYGYYREHQQEIDRKIAEENAQNTVEGVQGIILVAMIIIALFIGAYFVIYPPLSRKVLQKYYNRADGTPDRSVKDMLQAHPKLEKICKLHKICFVALVASYTPLILGSDNMRILSHQNFLYKAGSVVGVFATFATLVVGIIPLVLAYKARKRAKQNELTAKMNQQ